VPPDGVETGRLLAQGDQGRVHGSDLVLDIVGERAAPSPYQVRPTQGP